MGLSHVSSLLFEVPVRSGRGDSGFVFSWKVTEHGAITAGTTLVTGYKYSD